MWLILEEWGCFDMGVCYLVFRKSNLVFFNFQSFLSLSGMPLDFLCWEHLQHGSWGHSTLTTVIGWFSGVWCFQVPMKEESWFCWQRIDFSNVGFQESGPPGVVSHSLLDPCLPLHLFVFLYHGLLYIHVCPSGEPLRPERLHHCGCLYVFSHGCRVGKCREVSI